MSDVICDESAIYYLILMYFTINPSFPFGPTVSGAHAPPPPPFHFHLPFPGSRHDTVFTERMDSLFANVPASTGI